jgi:hypothetical protein
MEELVKKIDELKELMIASNVTHIEINRCKQWKDEDSDEVVDVFETSIHQDDRNMPWRRTRGYAGYSRRV